MTLARNLTDFRTPPQPLAAYRPDWKSEITRMRRRIERERTPTGQDALAFKTGVGGLVDAEFLAQTWAMEGGWFEPNTLASLLRARDTGALPQVEADDLIESFRRLRRMESILRRWSFEGEAVLPDRSRPPLPRRRPVRISVRRSRSWKTWPAGGRRSGPSTPPTWAVDLRRLRQPTTYGDGAPRNRSRTFRQSSVARPAVEASV